MIVLSRQITLTIATTILVFVLFITPFQIIRSATFKQNSLARVDISVIEKRFTPVKLSLPHNTRIGYLGPNNKALLEKNYSLAKEFSAAQYALIPTILEIGTRPQIIIGDFTDEITANQKIKENKLHVIKNYHNGLYLLTHNNL